MCVSFNYKIIVEYLHGFLILKPQSPRPWEQWEVISVEKWAGVGRAARTSAQLLLAGATTCLCMWDRWEQSWGWEGADPPMPRVGLGQLCSALLSSRRARRQRCASYCCSQSPAVPQRAAVLGYQKDGWIWKTICGILTVSRAFFLMRTPIPVFLCVLGRLFSHLAARLTLLWDAFLLSNCVLLRSGSRQAESSSSQQEIQYQVAVWQGSGAFGLLFQVALQSLQVLAQIYGMVVESLFVSSSGCFLCD